MTDKVIFLGVRHDVNRIMQAMDIFVLPSIFEGLPIVGIEAQASGLPCLFSDKITKESKIRDNVEFLSIDDAKIWCTKLNEYEYMRLDRNSAVDEVRNAGYDVVQESKKLKNFFVKNGKEG